MLAVKGYGALELINKTADKLVFRSTRLLDKRKIIIKTTESEHPSLKNTAQMNHEFQILKMLDHPGIIKAYDLIREKQRTFLILEDAGYTILSKLILQNPLSLDQFFKIAIQLCDIISFIHQHKIIHKDIKPSSIIINPSSLEIKLIDFNIASRRREVVNMNLSNTFTEGTLAYMSPEQTGRINRAIDYRTDLYSLGITFFEMLAGDVPFQSSDPLEIIYCHLAKTPPLINTINEQIPTQLAKIIEKLVAKLPEERYLSAMGLKEDLLECKKQWDANHNITPFPLSQNDFYEQLNISQKLYGRENQITKMMEILDKTINGEREILLLSGYAGVGKTTLIKELYKPITMSKGYFINGKFSQIKSGVPYQAFIEAFQQLIRQILSEPQERLEQIKTRLLSKLKSNGQIIIDLVPELKLLIGAQDPVPELNTIETQNRFQLTLQNFIDAFTEPNHPIILFLDDWQWSDSASQNLLKIILKENKLNYMMIILSYRDNEVGNDHPFSYTLADIKKTNSNIHHKKLLPLPQHSIKQLIVDSFGKNFSETDSLTNVLIEKTHGNPFFINEFLQNIYKNNYLYYSAQNNKWICNIEPVKKMANTDNVVDLIVARIKNLPEETQEIIKIASCIGHKFEIHHLKLIVKKSLKELNKPLSIAIQENLITPMDDHYHLLEGLNSSEDIKETIYYQFNHDKIEQAAHLLLRPKEITEIHLQIGRLMRDTFNYDSSESLIEMVNHLNLGLLLIDNYEERIQLAELNLKAGTLAKMSNAYELAIQYFQKGLECLSKNLWEDNYLIAFNLYHGLSSTQYSIGKFNEAEEIFNFLLSKANTDKLKLDILMSMALLSINKTKFKETIDIVFKMLNTLGFKLNPNPGKVTLLKKIIQIRWLLKNKNYQQLYSAKEISDEKIKKILEVLNVAWTPAILTNPQLFALISFEILILTLKYGNSHYAISGYISYAIYLSNFDYDRKIEDKAYEFGKLAIKLVRKYDLSEFKSKYYPIYAFFISYRRHPIRKCFSYFKQGYISSITCGNLVDVGFNIHQMNATLFLSGDYLVNLIKKINSSLKLIKKFHDVDEHVCLTILKHFYLTLSAKKDINSSCYHHYQNSDLLLFIKENKLVKANLILHIYRCYYFGLMKQYPEALIELSKLDSIIKVTAPGIFLWSVYYFFYPLVIIALFKNFDKKNQKIYFKKLQKFMEILKLRSESNPENFANKYYLVKAEYAKLFNQSQDVIYYYLESIKAANNYGLIHEEGIANELLGQLYLNLNDLDAAKSHLQNAFSLFDIWGAKKKTAAMLAEYRQFLFTSQSTQVVSASGKDTTKILGTSLNLDSILKVSQAISSEIELNILLSKLLLIIIENSGAQRCLILTKRQTWIIEASGTVEAQDVNLVQTITLEESKAVPITLINYVIRKQEYLVLNDAAHSEYAETDPYLFSTQPKSILIMPIFFQGKLSNIIYLENNSITGAFTPQHIKVLQLLSLQAVISIENSRLYYQATHDPLTSLANRNLLNYHFSKNKYLYGTDNLICLAFIDLDFFKQINDTLGHEAGDKVLLRIAKHLTDSTRNEDLVVRLGGDEFVLMLNRLDNSLQAINIIKRLYEELKTTPIEIENKKIYLSLSIGMVFYPKDGESLEEIMRKADLALYKAKELGRNNYQIYNSALDQEKTP